MRARLACWIGIGVLVAGCSGESHQDLRAWMQEQGKGSKGKLDPLPQVRPYEPFTYNAFDLPDPFKPRKIEPVKSGGNLAPDLTRRKEPLEAYPLESLQIVGISDNEIKVKELVQDGTGDWTERSSTLQLADATDQRQERRR